MVSCCGSTVTVWEAGIWLPAVSDSSTDGGFGDVVAVAELLAETEALAVVVLVIDLLSLGDAVVGERWCFCVFDVVRV